MNSFISPFNAHTKEKIVKGVIKMTENYMEIFKFLIGKRIYVELNGAISCISDLGIVEDVSEDNFQIEITAEYDDFTIFKDSGFNLDRDNDLIDEENEDTFLFRVTFILGTITETLTAYFYEYEDE